jgi:hypothetical protein
VVILKALFPLSHRDLTHCISTECKFKALPVLSTRLLQKFLSVMISQNVLNLSYKVVVINLGQPDIQFFTLLFQALFPGDIIHNTFMS